MKGDFFSSWQLRRKQGKPRFVLVTSLLWSMFVAIFFFMIMATTEEQITLLKIVFVFSAFWIFGILVASIIWYRNEKKWHYWRSLTRKTKASQATAEDTSSPH